MMSETKAVYEVNASAPVATLPSVSNAQQVIAVMRIAEIAAGFAAECAERLTPRGQSLFWDCLLRAIKVRVKEVSNER